MTALYVRTIMVEGPESEDHVDLEEGNYSEMEDEVEEQVEEYEEDDGGDANAEEHDEEYGDSKTEDREEDLEQSPEENLEQSPEEELNCVDIEVAEDEEKPASPINEEEREKYSHLLSLPPHGSEVFIGGLPKDAGEEDLRDLCEPIGDIFEVRLIKDRDSGESKGYAFVAFKTKDVAQMAIEDLHGKEFKGKTLRCSLSETKNRLFIGNIPKSWTEDEFRKVIEGAGPGVENIELIKDPTNPARNRGFAFLLYYNNACADYSRKKMIDASFKLEGNTPTVTWADPKSSLDQSAAAAQVKALYVKNIPENTSTEQLKELFQRHGEVTKVVMPPGKGGKRDFGFIHYAERSSALKVIRDTEKYEINGQVLEVVLAKPQTEKKPDPSYSYGAAIYPPPVAHAGFGGGITAAPYGSLGAGLGVASSFNQPMIYGRGAVPTGMQMVPMVLPDGRIGYVFQQPGMQMPPPVRPRRVDRTNGSGRSGGDEGGRGRRYRPY